MHECETCYTECDCDGDDLSGPQPAGHVCINPDCGREDRDDWDSEPPDQQERQ